MESSDEYQLDISLHKEYTPKRPCVTRGTMLEISKRFVKELGPAADRLNLSSTQLTGIIAAAKNHGGGDIDKISLSKSTTNKHCASARTEKAAVIRRNFSCQTGQVNFDGKLLAELGGFWKVNRLAVILIQEDNSHILGIPQTDNSIGRAEAEMVKEYLDSWEVSDKIIA